MNREQRILWALLIQCPFFRGAAKGCPLESHRWTMSLEEKFQFVENLTPSEVESILSQHLQCMQKRQTRYQEGSQGEFENKKHEKFKEKYK